MANNSYVYAVARIRSMEQRLFSQATVEQLLACRDYESALAFLAEKGWGEKETDADAEQILRREEEKTWETIRELKVDLSAFEVLTYPHLYHNLKAAVKEVCTGARPADIYFRDCQISGETMADAVRRKDFRALPEHMRAAALEALEVMLTERDGQLCDVIVDRAALDAVRRAGQEAREKVLADYAEAFVAAADIRCAVRCARTRKKRAFLERALAQSGRLSRDRLIQAALQGEEEVLLFLEKNGFGEAAEALGRSNAAFECWCDNQVIRAIRPQKYNAFSAGPLAAYILARENEIKTVRIILTGKQCGLPDEAVRERVREMYV